MFVSKLQCAERGGNFSNLYPIHFSGLAALMSADIARNL